MRRTLVAIGWLALVIGWWLVWRGEGAWGCGFIALFALVRLATARPRTRAETTAAPDDAAQQPTPASAIAWPADEAAAALADEPMPPRVDHPLADTLPPDRESHHKARWRRLVWVSYGNAFLQGAIGLDDFYRHSLTWPAVATFREAADRRLIAEDGFAWLSALRQRGALRLSLDVDDSVPPFQGIEGWDPQAITCHFADRRERWRMGEEQSTAALAAQALDLGDPLGAGDSLAHHGGYTPEVDAYWRVAEWPGVEPEVHANWSTVAAEIHQALQAARFIDESAFVPPPPGPFWTGDESSEDWARFPVLPPDPALRVPHRLLNELVARRARFENDSHPKNEGNYWARLQGDPAALSRVGAYDDLLRALTGYVQRLAGSETRWQPRDLPRP